VRWKSRAHPSDILAVEDDLARRLVEQPAHHPRDGALARSRFADEGEARARREGERHAVDGGRAVGEALHEVTHLD
jgi:hypothetical protein